MIDFARTTPFRLVRRLATAGEGRPSLYLLVAERDAFDAVRADIGDEVHVQLGAGMRPVLASGARPDRLEEAFGGAPVVLMTFDAEARKLIESLDRHIVLLTRTGSVLLLADPQLAERLLAAAPNLRSRLSDILAIAPDEVFGGFRA